jgi:putative redox protein
MINVHWKGDMAFEAELESGNKLRMDAYPEHGGHNSGPTPVEALLSSIAGCSAMDVISILKKKKQDVTGYRIEISGVRTTPGEWPRPFVTITVRHILQGNNLDPVAVARAVELSDEKYCSVLATIRSSPKVESSWAVEAPATI